MQEKKTLEQTADAILGSGVTITVDVQACSRLEKLLQKWKWQEAKRTFVVKPLVLGSLVRISKLLLSLDNSLLTHEILEDKNRFQLLNVNYELMERHAEIMARIIAVAVTNEKEEPSKKLVNFFLYNLTPAELVQVFRVVLVQMDISGFTASIISVRGLNVLASEDAGASPAGTNPQTQGSQIASGTSSAA